MKTKSTILIIAALLFSLSINAQSKQLTIQEIIDQVSIDSLTYFVEELSGERPTLINGSPYTIVSRHKNSPSNDKAADYIKQKLQSYGYQTFDQNFSSTGRNVYAIQTGTDTPDQKYIICAHYDDMPSGSIAPGADDNASGTAAVLEAARILSGYSFPFTVVYALWDEEEQGLVGSNYYATQAAAAGEIIKGVVNMDMIAWEGNDIDIVDVHTRNVGGSYELSDKAVEINGAYNLDLILDLKDPGSTYSDHASFWNSGYGAILLIEDGSDFHPYYHTVNDLIQYFDNQFYLKCAKLSIATFASMAMNMTMSISHEPIASMTTTGDISVSTTINTGLEIGAGSAAPRLYYRMNSGTGFSEFYELTPTTATKSADFNFVIPAPPLGTLIQYYLAAQTTDGSLVVTLPSGGSGINPPGNVPPQEFFQFYVAPLEVAFTDNCANMNYWQSNSTWNTTSSKYVSAPYSFTDSPSGNYPANASSILTTLNEVDLTNVVGAELKFKSQWDIEENWDYGQVQISTDGTNWTPLVGIYTNDGTGSFQPNGQPVYDGVQAAWVEESIDLFDYVGSSVKLRFALYSDSYVEEDGWYIDDIEVVTYSVVPVELTSFTASSSESGIVLNWSTATEINNHGFEIQKSNDKKNWKVAGFVEGNGSSTNMNQYSYIDSSPANGRNYYRIKQLDYNGTFEIYGPVYVDFVGVSEFALMQNYPNPFNPSTQINFAVSEKSFVTLKVYDILGKEISTLVNDELDAGYHKATFNAENLASGIYIYTITAGDFISTKKMMLIR